MNTWKFTKPPPASKNPLKKRKLGFQARRPLCNCGQPAVAKAIVRVGLDGCYTVTLYLCAACLAYEQSSSDVPPPLTITPIKPL